MLPSSSLARVCPSRSQGHGSFSGQAAVGSRPKLAPVKKQLAATVTLSCQDKSPAFGFKFWTSAIAMWCWDIGTKRSKD